MSHCIWRVTWWQTSRSSYTRRITPQEIIVSYTQVRETIARNYFMLHTWERSMFSCKILFLTPTFFERPLLSAPCGVTYRGLSYDDHLDSLSRNTVTGACTYTTTKCNVTRLQNGITQGHSNSCSNWPVSHCAVRLNMLYFVVFFLFFFASFLLSLPLSL